MKQALAVVHGRTTLLFAFIFCFFLAGNAFADGKTTWLPDFKKDTHVYVDPQLQTTNPALSQIAAISDKLVEQGKRNNLEVYVVATEAGSEQLPSDGRNETPWGEAKKNELMLLWQQQADFPKANAIVIVWVNHKSFANDPWHVASWTGTHLTNDYQMDSYYVDRLMTPILTQHAATDPSFALLQTIAAVNNDIDTYAQRKASQEQSDRALGTFFSWLWKIVVGAFVLFLIGAGINELIKANLGTSGVKKNARDKINEWEEQLSGADNLATKLRTSYLGLIEHAENGEEHPFEGETLAAFDVAAQDFREFTARDNAAKARLEEAEKAARGTFAGGYNLAVELLTTTPIKVQGPAITLKNVQMFEDFSPSTRYTPPELLAAMIEIFNKSNSVLADIIAKVSQAVEEKKAAEKLSVVLPPLQDQLSKAGLKLDSYQERLKLFDDGHVEAARAALRDPLAHLEALVQMRQSAGDVKTEMEEALAAKQHAK